MHRPRLVDAGRKMDVHRNFSDRVSASALLSPNFGTGALRTFLRRRARGSEKKSSWTAYYSQGFPLLYWGLGENKTMNASIPRLNLRRLRTVLQPFIQAAHAHVSDEFEARTDADQSTRVANALGRFRQFTWNARHPDGPSDAFHRNPSEHPPPCLLPQHSSGAAVSFVGACRPSPDPTNP